MFASRFFLPLVTLLAFGCASSPAVNYSSVSPVVPGPGQVLGVDQALIIVDSSSSLGANGWTSAQKGATTFVDGMPNGSYGAGSMVFGGSERAGTSISSFNRAGLRSSISGVSHMGNNTPLDGVLSEAYGAIQNKPGDLAIVLFSDGVPTEGGIAQPSYRTIEAGQRLVRSRAERVCIHTVQVGDSASGASLLRKLAALSNCGSSRKASDLASSAAVKGFEETVFFVAGNAPKPAPRAAAPGDADQDGVIDAKDRCPKTPRGLTVDSTGCWVLRDLRFANDSAVIRPVYEPELNNAVQVLRENPAMRIRVLGHTDSNGPEAYNQALSERRANSVRDYLVGGGIAAGRIEAVGKGESNPIASNATPEGRAENRRINFEVLD